MKQIDYSRDSVEYITAPVTCSVDPTMVVAISIRFGTAAHVWLPAGWSGASVPATLPGGISGFKRTAQTTSVVTFSAANYPQSMYKVYVRLTDSPEAPILEAGTIRITS